MTTRTWVGTPGHVTEVNGRPLKQPADTMVGRPARRPALDRMVCKLRRALQRPSADRPTPSPDPSEALAEKRRRQLERIAADPAVQKRLDQARASCRDAIESEARELAISTARERVAALERARDRELASRGTYRRDAELLRVGRALDRARADLREALHAEARARGERLAAARLQGHA